VLPDSNGISPVPPYLGTTASDTVSFRVRDYYPLWFVFPDASAKKRCGTPVNRVQSPRNPIQQAGWFRLFRFRSPLLPESHLIYFPPGTKMFQFPGCATRPYEFRSCSPTRGRRGFPIRTSPDQSLLGSSPRLFAACYVLHRSFESRHSPHASLTFFFPSLRPQTSDESDVHGQKRLTTGNFRSLSSSFSFTSFAHGPYHREMIACTFDNICLTSPTVTPVPVSAGV
jgi:hypothetical protein